MLKRGSALLLAVALSVQPASAAEAPPDAPAPRVLGGTPAPLGKWPEAAAVYFGEDMDCTGVLVAPTVVLTARHCDAPNLSHVLVGTNSLEQGGDRIPVVSRVPFPTDESFDALVLVLGRPATVTPRPVATGWAQFEVVADAVVQVVGYGALDRDASQYSPLLHEAETRIVDPGCESDDDGCNPRLRPGGELIAGGMGVDSCPGDSGGPLYVRTDFGDFVAGLTSRSLRTSAYPCQDGGIYTQVNAIADWVEQAAGVPIARGPAPFAEPLVAAPVGGETTIIPGDPRATRHRFSITEPPQKGVASIDSNGRVRYCPNGHVGDERLAVRVTDRDRSRRSLVVSIPIQAVEGEAADCEVDVEDGGCCSVNAHRPSVLLLLLPAILFLRRRRRT